MKRRMNDLFTFTVTYLPVLPAHTTYIMTYVTHIQSSNLGLLGHRFVKSSTLVYLKALDFERSKVCINTRIYTYKYIYIYVYTYMHISICILSKYMR